MTRAVIVLSFAVAALLFAQDAAQENAQPIRLEAGDYRWVPFTIRQTPAEVDCSFQVVEGNASVHIELMPSSEFRLFERGRDHDAMTRTPDGRGGEFRQMIAEPGRYAVVVVNARNAPPATVTLHVETNMNPARSIARTLSPARRMIVIAISMAVFIAIVTWSSRRLLRAVRH
jgi:hypothetical protein